MKPYYVTTPLYYVNAPPHLGHAYTTVIADVLARYHRMRRGKDQVFFLTGTDEHGQKIQQAAAAAGQTPAAFVEAAVPVFRRLWTTLGITFDDFIRTTEPRHTQGVQQAVARLCQAGQITTGTYTGWYCTPCETFWPGLTLAPGGAPVCPDCRRPVEQIQEENYFFPLEPHREWLRRVIRGDDPATPMAILPETRRREVLAFLEQPLQPLCISRPAARLAWGIPLPSPPCDPGYVTYVWFDALLNYVTAVGYPAADGRWPADVHLIGKDILRPHAVYWPIMLHALGLPPPTTVAAHGWWLVEGEKMSKSRGNIVDPHTVIAEYGVDAYRYFLLREIPFGQDGTFSEQALEKRYTADLANDLGNLVYRTLTMLEKYCDGIIPSAGEADTTRFQADIMETWGPRPVDPLAREVDRYDFQRALAKVWNVIDRANGLIDSQKPWVLARQGQQDGAATQQLHGVLVVLASTLRALAVWLWPFLPTTGEQIWRQLGCPGQVADVPWDHAWRAGTTAGQRIQKGAPLFPRRDVR